MIHEALAELRELFLDLVDLVGLEGEPRARAAALFDELLDVLLDEDDEDEALDVLDELAGFLDSLLAFDVLVPGFVGSMLEAKDGDVIEDGLRWIAELVKPSPERKAARLERKEGRLTRRLKRRGGRKARREDRQNRQNRRKVRRAARRG